MAEQDKQLISEYMGWELSVYSREYYYIPKNGKVVYFDLTDAGLVVAEMQKRGEWWEFHNFARNLYYTTNRSGLKIDYNFTAWLFVAENFFGAMAAWIKEGKK